MEDIEKLKSDIDDVNNKLKVIKDLYERNYSVGHTQAVIQTLKVMGSGTVLVHNRHYGREILEKSGTKHDSHAISWKNLSHRHISKSHRPILPDNGFMEEMLIRITSILDFAWEKLCDLHTEVNIKRDRIVALKRKNKEVLRDNQKLAKKNKKLKEKIRSLNSKLQENE